ncbi:MAG: nitroreductase family protein [Gammaproteobacteria bacterium]|nr:nitroreductase family protein [Gammaproteobacteria bacterium]
MLTTKEAIEKRRSIRKFKPDVIPQEALGELIEAARLAPSGSNTQPWRFKIVNDQETKNKLAEAAYNQKFIATAPTVLVCCASLKEYADSMARGAKDLGKTMAIEPHILKTLENRADALRPLTSAQLGPIVGFHVAIAIEHIVLRALDFGLGTCWVKLVDTEKVHQLFGWDENISIVALLPIGYPSEDPKPRKRKQLSEIII